MNDRFVHYGHSEFNIQLFDPIKDELMPWIKPHGGLWASPINPPNIGWKQWCLENDFRIGLLDECFYFSIKPEAKGLIITNIKELETKLKPYLIHDNLFGDNIRGIRFESIVQSGYDYIYFEINSMDLHFALYGWDCDSVLIFQPDCMVLEEK